MLLKQNNLNNLIVSLIFSGTIIIPNNKLTYNEFLKYRDKVLHEYEIKKIDNTKTPILIEVENKINKIFLKFPELAKAWLESRKEQQYPYFEVFLLSKREFNQREGLIFSYPPEKSIKGDEISESININKDNKIDDFELAATIIYFMAQHSQNFLINQNYFFIYLASYYLGYKPSRLIEHVLTDQDKVIYGLYFLAGEKFFKSGYSLNCNELEKEVDKKLGEGAYYKIINSSEPFVELEKLLKKAGFKKSFKKSLEDFLKTANIKIIEE
jgi:hypothetical protein